jgi:hypothetical protein
MGAIILSLALFAAKLRKSEEKKEKSKIFFASAPRGANATHT